MSILEKFSDKDAWVAEYKGHTIKVVNQAKVTMYIDDQEVDKEKGIISITCVLKGTIPDTGETVTAILNGAEKIEMVCHFFIGEELESKRIVQHKDGTVTPVEKKN